MVVLVELRLCTYYGHAIATKAERLCFEGILEILVVFLELRLCTYNGHEKVVYLQKQKGCVPKQE